MMLLRRLLYHMVLFLSVACVCVAAGENAENEENLSTVDGDCSASDKESLKCENKTDVAEAARAACPDPRVKEKCPAEVGGSKANCLKDSEPPCPQPPEPKEPAPTTPKELASTTLKGSTEEVGLDTVSGDPAGERGDQGHSGPTGERGTDGSRQGSGTNTGSGPVSSSAPPTVSPPSQATTNEEKREASPTDTQTGNNGGSTKEESG
ncbi:uncharacterized protein TM35_000471420, partial [Trypanosoma theileri]